MESLRVRFAATALLALTFASPAGAAVLNGSFEADVQASSSFCLTFGAPRCTSLSDWSGEFYIVRGQHPFLASPEPYPEGQQIAMIQATNFVRQSVTIATPGAYELTWWDAGRAGFGGDQDYEVSFDGTVLGSFSTTTNSQWTRHSLVFSSVAGTFTLEIRGTKPFGLGDDSALLDDFRLAPFSVPEPDFAALGIAALMAAASGRRLRSR